MSLLDDWDAREEGGNASPSPPTSTNPFATSNPFAVEDPVPPPSTPSTTNPFGAPTEPKQEIYERAGSQSDLQHRASADSFLSLDGALGRSPREHDQGPSFFLRARLGPSTGPVSFEPGFNQPIRHVAAAQNLVLVCTDEQVYLWDVDKEPAPMADNCVVSNAVKSRNVFMDPSAQHLLLFLENGEAYYHSLVGLSKKLKSPVKAWRNLAVQSVAWISEETTEHTAHFLLGTRDGAIVEAMVEDQKVKEKSVKELFRLPDALPIFGLRLEAFPTASAMKKWFIMAVTAAPTRYYQFIGGPTVQDVFEAYKDALSEQTQFVELPSNLDYSELHMYTKVRRSSSMLDLIRFDLAFVQYIGQRATTFTMLTGAGIFHGKLSYGSQSPGEDVVKVYDMLSFPEETLSGQRLSTGAPLSMEETELHYVLLYADCLVVVNKINEQVVFDKKLEDEARVVQDAAAGRVWVFSSSSIYEFVIENESKNAWRLYLDKAIREGSGRDFQLAVQQCSTEEQKQEVITVQADFYFQSGKFDLAARYYADSSKPFEEVALVLIQEKQQDALKTYLLLKLKQMPMTAKTQRTILAVWIVEIYLEKLSSFARAQVEPITSLEEPDNQEEDPARAETVRSKESTVGAARLSVFQEFCGFLSDHFKSLDPARDTVFDMISSHGLVEELLYYADLAEDYERVITYYLQQEQFSMAVDRLLEQVKSDRGKVAELFYKYSPALIAKCPAKLVDAWIEARMLDPCKLLPAMVRCTEPKEAARFLEHCVYSQGNRDQAIHNFLVSLYAEGEIGNQSLLEFLKFDGACFEKKYALRQCTKRKQVRGCVAIYLQMGMFDAAVESALTVDIELAKECASSEVEGNDQFAGCYIQCHRV